MLKRWMLASLLLTLTGCSPPDGGPTGSPSTLPSASPTVAVTATPAPLASATPEPSATPLQPPALPPVAFEKLEPVPVLKPEMQANETWWADSGITENRLGYYATQESAAEVESRLLPSFATAENKPFLEGIPAVFDFEGSRVCLMRRGDTDFAQMFIIAPLADPPEVPEHVRKLKLPGLAQADLKGQKTLVVLATGYGLGDHMDHMLANAGLSITPTATPTP